MGLPSTPILDPFNTGANQLLTTRAGWAASVIYTGDTSMTTDSAPTYATQSSGEGSNRWVLGAADAESWYTIAAATAGTSYYSYTRLAASPPANGYELAWSPGGSLTLNKVVNNVETSLGSIGSIAHSVGDSMCLQSIGTTQAVYYKASGGSWVLQGSVTDATYTAAGDIGILAGAAASQFDVFGGGAIAAPGQIINYPRRGGTFYE